jgi:tRNA (guanine-N7-)-methyltransferase
MTAADREDPGRDANARAQASREKRPRAFIRRRGRMTAGQARARSALAHHVLGADAGPLDLAALFGRTAPAGLEIGFGMGQALLDWAASRPDWNLLGVEIYQPGTGSLLLGLERLGLRNVRAIEAAAETVLMHLIPRASLDEIRIFFPDPWPKSRHHKRRLIQPAFVALLAERLKPGGRVWIATDWLPYAEWIAQVFAAEPRFVPEAIDAPAAEGSTRERAATRFEARGLRLGHEIRDFRYTRVALAESG